MGPVEGVLPVIHTPWNADGSVDLESLKREVDWVFESGADGCAIALASDILRMTPAERIALIRAVAGFAGNRGPLIASVGAEDAEEAVRFAKAALDAGAAALMAIPPREHPADEAGLTRYFGAIVEATPLPLIVQDASSYVGSPMTPEFQAGLLDRWGPDRVWFKPEANPVGPLITRLNEMCGHRARIYEGSGGSGLIENWRRGIAGTIPGCDLLDAIVRIWRALGARLEAKAYRLWLPVCAIATLEGQAGLDGYLAIERFLMMKRGIFASDRARNAGAWAPDGHTKAEVLRLFAILRATVANEG